MNILTADVHEENTRTYHAKEVSGNAKHAQKSTDDNFFGSCEAVSHFLNFSTQSKPFLCATKMQPAASDPEERIKARMANVRG